MKIALSNAQLYQITNSQAWATIRAMTGLPAMWTLELYKVLKSPEASALMATLGTLIKEHGDGTTIATDHPALVELMQAESGLSLSELEIPKSVIERNSISVNDMLQTDWIIKWEIDND